MSPVSVKGKNVDLPQTNRSPPDRLDQSFLQMFQPDIAKNV